MESGTEQVVECFNKKIGVLEIEKQPQVKNDTAQQQQFFLSFISLPVYGIGKHKIDNGRKDDKDNKKATGLIKKIKGEETENVAPYCKIVPERIIQRNKNGKKENKKAVVEKQRVLRVIQELLKKSLDIKRWHSVFYLRVRLYFFNSFMIAS